MEFIKLSEDLINEIQEMRADLKTGKISAESYGMQLAGISQVEKQQKLIIQAKIAQEKFKKPIHQIGSVKLLSDPENELIECPGDNDDMIKRSLCLDWSGERKFPECICPQGKDTQTILLGK